MCVSMKATLFILIFSIFTPILSSACPLCATTTGVKVRAAIVGHDFIFNLVAVFLPFVFFILIAFVIYYGLPWSFRKSKSSDSPL